LTYLAGASGTNTFNINTLGSGDLTVDESSNDDKSTFNVGSLSEGTITLDGGEGNDTFNFGSNGVNFNLASLGRIHGDGDDGTNNLNIWYDSALGELFDQNGQIVLHNGTQYTTILDFSHIPSQLITVTNVAPTVAITGAPATSPEGTLLTLGSSVSDPGTADTFSYLWQVTASNGQVIADGAGASFSFTANDNGTYTVTLTALGSACASAGVASG